MHRASRAGAPRILPVTRPLSAPGIGHRPHSAAGCLIKVTRKSCSTRTHTHRLPHRLLEPGGHLSPYRGTPWALLTTPIPGASSAPCQLLFHTEPRDLGSPDLPCFSPRSLQAAPPHRPPPGRGSATVLTQSVTLHLPPLTEACDVQPASPLGCEARHLGLLASTCPAPACEDGPDERPRALPRPAPSPEPCLCVRYTGLTAAQPSRAPQLVRSPHLQRLPRPRGLTCCYSCFP